MLSLWYSQLQSLNFPLMLPGRVTTESLGVEGRNELIHLVGDNEDGELPSATRNNKTLFHLSPITLQVAIIPNPSSDEDCP